MVKSGKTSVPRSLHHVWQSLGASIGACRNAKLWSSELSGHTIVAVLLHYAHSFLSDPSHDCGAASYLCH
jgi:hypothetical protein